MLHTTAQAPKKIFYGPFFHALPLLVGLTEKNELCLVSFLKERKPETILKNWQAAWPKTEFLSKTIKSLPSDILLVGTPFQIKVWKTLCTIPIGQTLSYGKLAKRIGMPKAARAVGNALGANPVPIFIPCHRVIASDGSLGGFSSGLDIKKLLLKKENARA